MALEFLKESLTAVAVHAFLDEMYTAYTYESDVSWLEACLTGDRRR